MIKNISRFASSFSALLRDAPAVDMDDLVEDVRHAMLEALKPHIAFDAALPQAWFSISRATDIQTLWYLRSNLLGLLAENCGEPAAREALATITEMFRGAVPASQMPKETRFGKK